MQNDILLVAGPECHTLQSNAGVSLVDKDDASSAALLENECSELKEKLEELLKELSKVKQENQEMLQSQASSKDLQVCISEIPCLCLFLPTQQSFFVLQ